MWQYTWSVVTGVFALAFLVFYTKLELKTNGDYSKPRLDSRRNSDCGERVDFVSGGDSDNLC